MFCFSAIQKRNQSQAWLGLGGVCVKTRTSSNSIPVLLRDLYRNNMKGTRLTTRLHTVLTRFIRKQVSFIVCIMLARGFVLERKI